MFDKFHEECGVVAIYGHPEAAKMAYLGLYALQHRGQESAGICTSDGDQIYSQKSMGHVADIFTSDVIDKLTLLMNRVRQASITREIIEIVSGASALE